MLYYNSRTKPLKTKAMSLWNDNHGAALKSNPYSLIGRLLLTQASLQITQGSRRVKPSKLSLFPSDSESRSKLNMVTIQFVKARQIFDSRGNPTVEVWFPKIDHHFRCFLRF